MLYKISLTHLRGTLKYAFNLFGTPKIGHYLKTTYKLIAEFSKMHNYSTADKLLSFST